MKALKIVHIGAGSGFVLSIARELLGNEIFDNAEFVLADPAADRLKSAYKVVTEELAKKPNHIKVSCFEKNADALPGADYVITSCEPNRYENWYYDLMIPEQFGSFQVKGENGGPGGIIHATRNILMFKKILADIERLAPQAWLMNFTNPMSFLCTYFKNYSKVRALGFCHQVHGSFGVIAEMLGMKPGELEVISAGVNHLNWLFDIRRHGGRESVMKEFLALVRDSKYWHERFKNIPEQTFTLKVLDTFNMYPVGYDDHIIEYMPFFWTKEEWDKYHIRSLTETYRGMAEKKQHILEITRLLGKEFDKPPFPADPDHPYYAENPCAVIVALETNTPTYFDAINIRNNGAVGNLPDDVILDVPAVCIGGEVRSIHVGNLPAGPLEICRRQTVLHEMLSAAVENLDNSLMVQILCLCPYITSITQAENIWNAYKEHYKLDFFR
jgi:alpha-galactosidase